MLLRRHILYVEFVFVSVFLLHLAEEVSRFNAYVHMHMPTAGATC